MAGRGQDGQHQTGKLIVPLHFSGVPVFRYARERLRIGRIFSVIHAENAASLGVARKFGLEREGAVWMSGRSFDR